MAKSLLTPEMEASIDRVMKQLKLQGPISGKRYLNTKQLLSEYNATERILLGASRSNRKLFKRNLQAQSQFFNFLLFEHISLLLMLKDFNSLDNKTAKGVKRYTTSFTALQTLCFLLHNAIHNLMAIRDLLSTGFDLQARVLFRNYIETMETSLAVLLDPDFLSLYMYEPPSEDEAKKQWNKTKPSAIVRVIEKNLYKIPAIVDIWAIIKKTRDLLYSQTSMGVHVQHVSVFCTTFPAMIGTDEVRGGLGGVVTNATKNTLYDISYYSKLVVDVVCTIIVKHCHLPLPKFKKEGWFHLVINSINRQLFLENMIPEGLRKTQKRPA